MKKQVAKTISILSLFVMLAISANNVQGECHTCKPLAKYAASTATQTTGLASTQDTTTIDAQPVGDVSFVTLFWVELATVFAQLI